MAGHTPSQMPAAPGIAHEKDSAYGSRWRAPWIQACESLVHPERAVAHKVCQRYANSRRAISFSCEFASAGWARLPIVTKLASDMHWQTCMQQVHFSDN